MTDRGHAERLDVLQVLRLRLHRLEPPRPIRSTSAAAAFVRERGLVLATGCSSLPVLDEAIAGRAIAGSWMAAPKAGCVYHILRRLRAQNIVAAPLILGTETLIDPALGPAVERGE